MDEEASMSASPQKQRSSSSRSKQKLIPEVVIYTDRLPRSGLSKSSSSHSGSQRKGSTTNTTGTTMIVGNGDAMTMKRETEQHQEDDAAFAGLTRIEQIRLRARLKAEEEDRKLEEAEAKKVAVSAAEAQRRAKNGVTGRDKEGRSISDEYQDVDSDDDNEDDEELADVIIRSRPSTNGAGQKSSSPLSSAPTPLLTPLSSGIVTPSSLEQRQETSLSPLLDGGDDDNDDTLIMDPLPSYSTSRSASQESTGMAPALTSSASQRTRRSTARVEPYVFRPSLEPLSQRRKQLLVAKQSAAVQAKLIEKGQFRSGPTSSSTEKGGELMEKAFRDHRRDKRKGMDAKSLMRTVQMAQAGMERLQETAEREEEEGGMRERGEAMTDREGEEGDGGEKDWNDETSSNSSSSSEGEAEANRKDPEKTEASEKRVKFAYTSPSKEREAERRRFAHLLGNASDDEDGAQVFDILQRDREGIKKVRSHQLGESSADTEWSVWKKGRPEIHLEPFPKDALAKSVRDDALIASLLDSHLLLGDVKESRRLTDWILRSAVLAPSGELAHAAVRFILRSLRGGNSTVLRKIILEELPALLLELGSKEEIVSFCFLDGKDAASTLMPAARLRSREGRKTQMRRGDRGRAVGRLIQILEAVVASTETEEIDEVEHSTLIALFLYALHLGVDQGLERLTVQVGRLLTAALNLIHRGASSIGVVNSLLTGKIVSMLIDEPPSIRAIILDRIPSVTIPSRSLQRSIAYRALLLSTSDAKETNGDTDSNEKNKSNDDGKIDLGRLSSILESRDGFINPVLATETRDYLSIDANLNILCFVFNDLALQLFEHDSKQEQDGQEWKGETRNAGSVLLRVVSAYHQTQQQDMQQDGESRRRKEGQADGVTTTMNNDENKNANRVSVAKIEAIQKIIKSLRSIGGKIQDGKGAFLDRSKAKDHLQRLHLMLTYELSYFGLVGEGGRINGGGDNKNNNQGGRHHHLFSNSMKQKSLSSFLQEV